MRIARQMGSGLASRSSPAAILAMFCLIGAGSLAAQIPNQDEGAAMGAPEVWRPGRPDGPTPLDFRPVGELVDGIQIQLSNGDVVVAADWPALFVANGARRCTATVVGPATILTAAHCVDAGLAPGATGAQTVSATATIGSQRFQLACMIPREYASYPPPTQGGVRVSFDYALCNLDHAVDLGRIRPEAIDTQLPLAAGTEILMTGYGCVDVRVTPAGIITWNDADGNLRMKEEKIAQVGQSSGPEPRGVWVETVAGAGEPTLCPGDSGGPVLRGAIVADGDRPRRVVGVNSALGKVRRPGGWELLSWMAPLATAEFRTLLGTYVTRYPQAVICGHNRPAGTIGCHA